MYYRYIALIAGGIGPNTWDKEIEIQGINIKDAIINLEVRLIREGYSIENVISIEQTN